VTAVTRRALRHWPWGARATVAAATAVTGRAFVTRPGGTVATVGAVIAVTWRAFVTRPGGDGGHRGRRDRRDRGNGIPLGFAVAAVTTVVVEPRPARTLIWWAEGPRCRRERHDRVTVVLVRTSRRGLRWPWHSTKMSNGSEPRGRPWGPRQNRRQDRALEAAGDRNRK
jgi:hypothetical protein